MKVSHEFIPYEQALELKELGFDEACICYYDIEDSYKLKPTPMREEVNAFHFNSTSIMVAAPLYQQAFRWFRDKHNLFSSVSVDQTMEPKFCYSLSKYAEPYDWTTLVFNSELYYTYEEAELACLKKLIEIVKQHEGDSKM